MTKQDALSATIKKFTNLMDGDILPGVSVTNVINYYEALINNTSIPKDNRVSGIESNFIDDILEDQALNEADYWDGDESYNFLQ